ncbi:MAG: CDP-alcohol phosphatidyltransferase family protein [Paracoccaceae bacterium]|nr:CDP-alcohol phosphatidyltransferase family protein [Paracoccaceae bacterium]MDE2912091.1 CDP-alcohol phosphatidyltransferase family protein [Paracoccaceae bacterium]
MTPRLKALAVHYLTASGAVFAILAMLAAAEEKWGLMFFWLVVAFFVDGIDGPLARRYDIRTHAPEYDGSLLDLIVDYLTYVFIPAFALFKSGLLPGWTGWIAIVVITYASAIYFADTRMKTRDQSFAGFPACWNMVILVLFALQPNFWIILTVVVVVAATMFTNLKFIHPVRTERWRAVSLPVAAVWTASAGTSAWLKFEPGPVVIVLLSASSIYLVVAGILQQLIPPRNRDPEPGQDGLGR